MAIDFTIGGILCICIFVFLFLKHIKRCYKLATLPIFVILITYFRFFGYYSDMKLDNYVNVLMAISLVIFLISFFIGSHLKLIRVGKYYEKLSTTKLKFNRANYLTSVSSIRVYLYIVICYCIFDLWLNTQLYGSLQNALIRFYGKPELEGIPTIYKTIQIFLYKALVAFVFVYRFFLDISARKTKLIYLIVALLVLIAIPRGSRGAATLPLIMMVAADLFAATYSHRFKLLSNIKEYAVIVSLTVVIILSLTTIRQINFDDIRDLYTVVERIDFKEAQDDYSEGEGNLLLSDCQFCFKHYGNKQKYLGLTYTFETIILGPVPRVLMPKKKVSFGYVLNESKRGGNSLDPNHLIYPYSVCWAAGVAGEGWANGGFLGLILYSVVMGLYSGICAKMYNKMFKTITPLRVLFGLLFFQMSSSFIRGDILSGFTQGLYPLIIITLLIVTYNKINKIVI